MKSIYYTALESLYRMIAGGQAYDLIVSTATSLMSEDRTNDEKRRMVKNAVMPFIRSWGKDILSAIIAFAVTSIKLEIARKERDGE